MLTWAYVIAALCSRPFMSCVPWCLLDPARSMLLFPYWHWHCHTCCHHVWAPFCRCVSIAAGYISTAEQIWIINNRQCYSASRWLYWIIQFAPYNIHVCISKGNVVYDAHVILLQLNCKEWYGKTHSDLYYFLKCFSFIRLWLCSRFSQ